MELAHENGVLLSNIILIFILILYIVKKKKIIKSYTPFTLVISGGIGNLIDRIFRGYVIDFINIKFFKFLIFNIADICIITGVIGIIVNEIKRQNDS